MGGHGCEGPMVSRRVGQSQFQPVSPSHTRQTGRGKQADSGFNLNVKRTAGGKGRTLGGRGRGSGPLGEIQQQGRGGEGRALV